MKRLNYKEYGEGEPVVILHGLLGMLDNWHSFAKKLAEDYWVITVDQRNHGKSFHSNDFDYKLLSEDLNQFLDEMHIPQCHLMGHSMGGKTVMSYLVEYGDKVEKAIVVDIAPQSFGGGHEVIFNALLDLDIENIKTRKEAEAFLKSRLGQMSTVYFLLKNLARHKEGKGFRWKANVQALRNSYDLIKGNIESEWPIDNDVLFVKGALSDYINEKEFDMVKDIFPNAHLNIIQDAGHWVHADQPEVLLEEVLNFLK